MKNIEQALSDPAPRQYASILSYMAGISTLAQTTRNFEDITVKQTTTEKPFNVQVHNNPRKEQWYSGQLHENFEDFADWTVNNGSLTRVS